MLRFRLAYCLLQTKQHERARPHLMTARDMGPFGTERYAQGLANMLGSSMVAIQELKRNPYTEDSRWMHYFLSTGLNSYIDTALKHISPPGKDTAPSFDPEDSLDKLVGEQAD